MARLANSNAVVLFRDTAAGFFIIASKRIPIFGVQFSEGLALFGREEIDATTSSCC
jgi:hypothetical protein